MRPERPRGLHWPWLMGAGPVDHGEAEMPSKKIVCLGGGGGYFRFALPDLLVAEELSGSEVLLYDIDTERSDVMADYGARLASEAGTGMRVRAVHERSEALDGADYAISAIGGAGASGAGTVYGTGPHRHDVEIPARYGIYQVIGDTAGPGGLMMALRSIPAYIDICRDMEKRCPDALLLNHSNPMAPLCRAMNKYTDITAIGLCHGVQNGYNFYAKLLEVDPHELEIRWVGTNHYYWALSIRHRGCDVTGEALRRLVESEDAPELSRRLSEVYGYPLLFPADSHAIEFYPFLARLTGPEEMPYGLEEHEHFLFGEGEDAEALSREEQLPRTRRELAEMALPEGPSDPVTGEGLGVLIAALATGRRHVHVVNIPNRGCVPNLPDHAVLELEGVTGGGVVQGIWVGEAPTALAGLLQKRTAWQELVADAGVKGDRRLALQALLTDEMAIRPERAARMLDELLAASADYLPQFN
jgi:alpha-galactosidase